ncbi:N-acetyltransferase [Paenibacillaceae bacterium]|nr:N-acetyltransferase [Paenibacillaceae bacterium]
MKLPVICKKLAARIELSETAFFTSRISSIEDRSGNPEGIEIRKFGQATAFFSATMPWGVFNCVKGFAAEDADKLVEIISFYKARNRAFQLDVNPAGCSPQLVKALIAGGLYQDSFHSVLYGLPVDKQLVKGVPDEELSVKERQVEKLPVVPEAITIREVDNEEEFERYAEVHCVGSGLSAADKHHFINNNIGLLHRPGWRLFLAYWHDAPAAVAAMHYDIDNNIASCALAATAPEFRRRGLQTALLYRRMYEAGQSNCELVAAQAAFGSSSQHNMERASMRIAWTRGVWTWVP